MPYSTGTTIHSMYSEANNESIDYDFYDLKDEGDSNMGVQSVEIKPMKKADSRSTKTNEKNSTKQKTDLLNTRLTEASLLKSIAYRTTGDEQSSESSGDESGIDSRSHIGNEEPNNSHGADVSRSSSSPTSELTSITPRSTASTTCSTCADKENLDDDDGDNNNDDEKDEYDFDDDYSITNQISSDESDESDKNDMKLLSSAVDHMRIYNTSQMGFNPSWNRQRRRNMTFSNEQVRQINRENDILLRKIMSYSKPRRPSLSTVHNVPQVKASSEINRSKQMKQIERENYIMLKRIRDVKPTQKMHTPKPKI